MLNAVRELGIVGRGSVVFDIGANIGNYIVFFAKILGAKQVQAFEPQEYCAPVLKEKLGLNAINTV